MYAASYYLKHCAQNIFIYKTVTFIYNSMKNSTPVIFITIIVFHACNKDYKISLGNSKLKYNSRSQFRKANIAAVTIKTAFHSFISISFRQLINHAMILINYLDLLHLIHYNIYILLLQVLIHS